MTGGWLNSVLQCASCIGVHVYAQEARPSNSVAATSVSIMAVGASATDNKMVFKKAVQPVVAK